MTEYPQDVSKDTMCIFMRLLKFATFSREQLEKYHGDSSEGTCLYCAIHLRMMLTKFTDYTIFVRGGDGSEEDGGFRDGNGDMHGHYWVEVHTPGGCFIMDITADQFGGNKITVCHAEEPPAKNYIPGDQLVVDGHVSEIVADLGLS